MVLNAPATHKTISSSHLLHPPSLIQVTPRGHTAEVNVTEVFAKLVFSFENGVFTFLVTGEVGLFQDRLCK